MLNTEFQQAILTASEYPNCGNIVWELPPTPQPEGGIKIDGKVNDWENTGIPQMLTDAQGDSYEGKVMDLTGLWMTTDETYLYIRVDAVSGPGASQWSLVFYLNTNNAGNCKGANLKLGIRSDEPTSFTIREIITCDQKGETTAYSGAKFIWKDALEIRIPLVYLGDPTSLNITYVESYLDKGGDNWSRPDDMP